MTVPPNELLRGLRLIGISSREARLYLALAQIGPAAARDVARISRVHRATTYRGLARLTRRGLVAGTGTRPQGFVSLAPETIFRRLASFLREEEEIVGSLAEVYGHWASAVPGVPARSHSWLVSADPPREPSPFGHPALTMLAGARRSVELMVHPASMAAKYRGQLAAVLTRLVRSGVRTRVISDVTMVDRRFLRGFVRDGTGEAPSLEVRHFTPAAAHFYVIDERLLVRFPVRVESGRTSETGVVTDEPMRIRTQLARFEGIWAEATASRARPRLDPPAHNGNSWAPAPPA
jgi:sugar-specific transcriptional regulator TrmB